MSRPFLITSLPRSRTAWFSVAATTARSVCIHEPTAHCQSFEELKELWLGKANGTAVGVSDSSLLFQIDRILSEIAPRTLIIERDAGECVRSFVRYIGTMRCNTRPLYRLCELAMERMDSVRDNPLCLFVKYEDLRDYMVSRRCLEWLIPGEEFPDLKALMRMNIQSDRSYNIALASKPHNGWHLPDELRLAA